MFSFSPLAKIWCVTFSQKSGVTSTLCFSHQERGPAGTCRCGDIVAGADAVPNLVPNPVPMEPGHPTGTVRSDGNLSPLSKGWKPGGRQGGGGNKS